MSVIVNLDATHTAIESGTRTFNARTVGNLNLALLKYVRQSTR
jgi:hypothetical protein